jgi:hypothetical protein
VNRSSANKRAKAGAVIAASALLVVGVGVAIDESSDDAANPSPAVSAHPMTGPARWAQSVDRICARAAERIDVGAPQGDSAQEITRFTTRIVIPQVRHEIDQIRALTTPPAIVDDARRALAMAELELARLGRDPLSISGDPFPRTDRILHDLGVRECGA